MRWLITIGLLAGLIYLFGQLPDKPGDAPFSLRVLDVGQGDSIYLRLPNNDDILIDGGPDDRVLGQLGRHMPITDRTIELLIISHNHADHIGGLDDVLKQYKVEQIWLSGALHTTDQFIELLTIIRDQNIPTQTVKAGDTVRLGETHDETELLVLHPTQNMTGQTPEEQHDSTIVVKISYKQFCALLTGDIEMVHEKTIRATAGSLGQQINCPVLKVSHHGSAYGSSAEFLATTQPKAALISAGKGNRYGHPAPSLLQRLKNAGATIYRTDQQGTLSVFSDGATFWTKTER